MKRRILALTLLVVGSAPATAQDVFVAPTFSTVLASSEQGYGADPLHQLYVTNRSTVPIIVFGVTLTACENLKQSCGGHPANVSVPAGQRRSVYKVQAKDTEHGFGYRWSFSFRADSSDAKVLAALRAYGARLAGEPAADSLSESSAPTSAPNAVARPADEPGPARQSGVLVNPVLEAVRRKAEAERARAPVSLRFKVGYGSILGSTMMPNARLQPTGACVDPTREAAYDHDPKIARTPWRPVVVPPGIGGPSVSVVHAVGSGQDSVTVAKELLVRFVADTGGTVIPESISVLESPDGRLSVRACQTLMGTHVQAAKNREGQSIQSWVQMPLSVSPF